MKQQYFNSPKQMLDLLMKDIDLYNMDTGEYVFRYTEEGSVAVYCLSIDEAKELSKESIISKEYWGAQLGPGGFVYDDPSHECFKAGDSSNLDYCTASYNSGRWFTTDDLQKAWNEGVAD